MPRTVDEGFRDFLKKLTPSSYESDAAKSHRASIEQCIKSNFGLLRFGAQGLSEMGHLSRATVMLTTWLIFRPRTSIRIRPFH